MLGGTDYFNILYDSPIPCMWVEMINHKDKKYYDIKILGLNKILKESITKEIKENSRYYVNGIKYSYLFSIIEELHKRKKVRTIELIDILQAYYEIDIKHISGNNYVLWFIKEIKLDEHIKLILDKMGISIWSKDKLGRYIYINKDFDLYPNATTEDIIGKTDFEVFPYEEAKAFNESDSYLLEGKSECIDANTFFNGHCYAGLNHVIKDKENNIVGTIGICIDNLKEKKSITNKISDAKMLEVISDTIPDSIFFKDTKGVFRHCNKVFAQRVNLNKDEIIGKKEDGIYTETHKIKKYKQEEEYVMSTKKSIISTSSYKGIDGNTKYLETIKVPFLDDYEMVGGVIGIARDISHRRESELEFERLRMEFFANLSHEFKTPLNLIFSSIQLIEYMMDKEGNSEKYECYTNIIKQNGYRILKMVNNLIDSTKLNSGVLELDKQNYDIVAFIENICDSVQYYSNIEEIELIFDTSLEEKVMAFDLEKMERIMLNLLSNAIKYNKEKGSIQVILDFDDEYAYIKVKDSGVGIPEEKLEDVFTLFKQINNRMTKISEGSGIGLSIVKSLVELHNGTITVHSEKNKGSEFFIKIPITICKLEKTSKKLNKYNKYVENIDIEFSDIYTSIK